MNAFSSTDASSEKTDRRLAASQRLTKSADFRVAFEQQNSYVGRFIVMLLRTADDASLRLGVIAGKRTLRRAVDRNRAKRLMREAYRLNRHQFSGVCDVVLIARRQIAKSSLTTVENDLLRLARKAGILIQRKVS